MAEDAADKTEEPTGKKLQQSRDKGMVAKSADFNSAIGLLAGTVLIWIFSDRLLNAMKGTMIESFRAIGTFETIPVDWQGLASSGFVAFLWMLAPVVGGVTVVSLISHFTQVGFLWTLEPLGPNFGKVFSLSGLSKLFSPASLVEIAKNVAKMIIVGLVGYKVVASHYKEYLMLADMDLAQFCHMLFSVSVEVILKSTVVLLLLGLADLVYQKRKLHKDLMMSKQEVKDESRSSEGDPHIKGKIKSLRMQMHRNLMMKELPKATVVITNPTFLAIAVRYVQGLDMAPVVIAKGKRLIAERIRDVAKQNQIPIVEDKPLARSLFEVAEVGEEIPQEYFAAVAEILAYVYSLKGQKTA
jgi:flagellar biosynthetic protein FlhB